MIKTIKIENAVFWFLVSAAVISAVLFLFLSDDLQLSAVLTPTGTDMPVLVIDAGHGGEDGGAVSLSGVHESEINLDISKKMAALSGLTGIKYAMTRDSENIVYPEGLKTTSKRKKYDQQRRVDFVNGTDNAVLISVHQNCYPHKSPHGPQSFYSKAEGSSPLAVLIQDSLNAVISPGNRRISMPVAENIYLFKSVKCPAVLVECGFISNPEESEKLDTEAYRLKIATVLISSYLRYMDTKE
ncbi:MAG: N-acetylmuramoyl-L-alanine amidase [Oscillospiraceae bacterium]|nr:N-acetylmuramoyl-L-alanine amidase [Oscillospiraceae bacterium]